MSQWQPQDPSARPPVTPPQWEGGAHVQPHAQSQYPPANAPQYPPPQYRGPHPPQPPRRVESLRARGLTPAGQFWYVLECIAFGAGYFTKVPAKKAMQDFGLCRMTSAEQFWYVVMCIALGAGYFAKLPTSKALSELPQFSQLPQLARLAGRVQPHVLHPESGSPAGGREHRHAVARLDQGAAHGKGREVVVLPLLAGDARVALEQARPRVAGVAVAQLGHAGVDAVDPAGVHVEHAGRGAVVPQFRHGRLPL